MKQLTAHEIDTWTRGGSDVIRKKPRKRPVEDHKRCPFDNGKPEQKGGPILNNGREIYWVGCRKCKVSQLGYSTRKASWAAWDKRA